MGQTLFEYFKLGIPFIFILIVAIMMIAIGIHFTLNFIRWIKMSSAARKESVKENFTILVSTVVGVIIIAIIVGAIGIGFGLFAHHVCGIQLDSERENAKTNTVQHIDQPHRVAE